MQKNSERKTLNKTVSIKDIISYSYFYKDFEKCEFYFDLKELQFYSREQMKSEFGYDDNLLDDEYTLRYVYSIIPMFYVIENSKIKEFLLQENNKKITKSVERMNQSEIEGIFQKMYDHNYGFGHRWVKYIEKYKTDTAIEWCRENNIPYTK